MRFRTSLGLLAAVLAFGGYAWLFELRGPPAPDDDRRAFALRADELQHLTLQQGKLRMGFEREGKGWRMTEPLQVRANAVLLSDLLGDLERLEISDRLPEVQPGPSVGLAPPVVSLTFSKGRGTESEGILLGAESADGRTAYAQRSGRHEVLLIPKAFGARLRKGLNDYRDHALLTLPKDRVLKLSLTYPDRRISVARKDSGWRVEEPLEALAGGDETDRALDTFYAVVADTFVSDEVKDLAPYGLDRPRLEVRVWDRVNGEPAGFAIGSKAQEKRPFEVQDLFYARPLGSSSVMTVRLSRIDDLVKEVRHFRSYRVLDGPWESIHGVEIEGHGGTLAAERTQPEGWKARAPHPGVLDAERFNELVATPLKLLQISAVEPAEEARLKQLGFDHPLGHITLSKADGGKQVLTIGSVDEKTREAFLTASGEGLLFTVGCSIRELLSLRYASLRSLRVLSTSLSSIQGLELQRPDGDLIFETEGRGWVQAKPERREGPLPALGALAGALATLNAEQWTAFGKPPWKDYGLAPPQVRVRITCVEGNQPPRIHVLELGRKDPSGYVFARFDQADEVMLLAPRILDLALADPAKAPPP